MQRLTAMFGLATSLLLIGCTSIQPKSDFDPEADFANVRTFSWISDKPLIVSTAQPVSPLLEGRLMRSIQSNLEAKGLRHVAKASAADVAISFTVGARDKIRVDSYPSMYRGGWGTGWGGAYYRDVDVTEYTEGRLAIDMFSVKGRSPVWHGWAEKRITSRDVENPQPVIDEVVTAILSKYPPI